MHFRQPLQEKKDDIQEKKEVVESPMSIVDSSVLSMSISKNESQILDEHLEDEDATTAQTDREMFFHVVEYRQDIYEYMKEIEVCLKYCYFYTPNFITSTRLSLMVFNIHLSC